MRLDSKARIVGSVGVITYFCILHVSVIVGVIINFIADLISIPYFIRTKSWDVVIMLSFYWWSVLRTSTWELSTRVAQHPQTVYITYIDRTPPHATPYQSNQVDYYPVTPAGKRYVRRVTWHPGADTEMTTFSTIVKSNGVWC